MARPVEGDKVEHRTFRGMVSYSDPRDDREGAAQLQVNAACLRAGELTVRRGLRPLTFDVDDQ